MSSKKMNKLDAAEMSVLCRTCRVSLEPLYIKIIG